MNNLGFSDIYEGMSTSFKVMVTEKMMEEFCDITGDINPLHTDESFAKLKGYPGRVVYGMMTAAFISTLGGVYLPGENCLIHGVECNFLKPVYIHDELEVRGKVIKVDERYQQITIKIRIVNQKGETVLLGKLKAGVLDG